MGETTFVRARGQARQAVALLRAAGAVIDDFAPAEAAQLAAVLGEAGRVASASALRCAVKVGRGAPGLLATVSGTAQATARRTIEAAEALEKAPEAAAAFERGELSADQAKVIAPVAAAAPDEAASLLDTARRSSLKELKAEAGRTLRRTRTEDDEVARERRVHARRYCKAYPGAGGGVRLEALFGTAAGALVMAAVAKEADALFEEHRAAGVEETRDHLMADALVALVTGSAKTQGAHVVVRADAAALTRGYVGEGEVCEIEGVGPVSVATAKRLLGEGFFTVVVKTGQDIATVSSMTRTVYRRIDEALKERDPTCVVPHCPASKGLQRHHWRTGYGTFGPTELDNLCLVCRVHHAMVTDGGWKLLGGPGKWKLFPPEPEPGSTPKRASEPEPKRTSEPEPRAGP